MGGEKGRRGVSFDPPESGSRGAGRVGCKPNDVLRRLGLVRSGGEHLTEVLEGRLAAFAPAVAADRLPVESHGDPDVGRGQATKHSSLLRDLQPRAIELEGARRPAAESDRIDADSDCARTVRSAPESFRELLRGQLGLLPGNGGRRKSSALELGRQGRRGSVHGAREEVVAGCRRRSRDHHLRAGSCCDGFDEGPQCVSGGPKLEEACCRRG